MNWNYIFLALALFILFEICYWIYYRSTSSPKLASYRLGSTHEVVKVKDLITGKYDEKLKEMKEYAMLSSIVYRDRKKQDYTKKINWTPMNVKEMTDEERKKSGLYYEIWKRKDKAPEVTFAIIFRGTRITSAKDWLTNLKWITSPFTKTNYYEELEILTPKIIAEIETYSKEDNKPFKIVSAGHSLGAGLAQYIAYATEKIKLVYGFHPSPVTGFYTIADPSKNVKNLEIYRIFESGEFLSYVRAIKRMFYKPKVKDPKITRIRFSASTGVNMLTQHSIDDFISFLGKIEKGEL